MKSLDINEVHDCLLGIAKEFDRICVKHNIPYYMIGGTMLGAIRHKGFIPWDDDRDFGVPIEHFYKLIAILEKELPYPYRCCTYNNHPAVLYNFFKIENMTTVIDSELMSLPLDQQLGVNIDVFPLNRCNIDDKAFNRIKNKRILLTGFEASITHPHSVIRKMVKWGLRLIAGGSHININNSIASIINKTNHGDNLCNLLGRWGKEKEMIPYVWFGQGKRYQFEDVSFVGPKESDEYLSHIYGDYMKMPPEESRIPHVNNVYLR